MGEVQPGLALDGPAVVQAPVFTREHQLLVNALGFCAVQVIEDSRFAVMIEVMGEILPLAARGSTIADRLCDAAEAVLAAYPTRNVRGRHGDWARAMMTAQAVLADVFQWRAGLALDACRAAQPKT